MTRVRQAFAAAGITAGALVLAAAPASAAPVRVEVANNGSAPITVDATYNPPTFVFSVSSGCGDASPLSTFTICLPGGAVLSFTVNLPPAD